MSILSRPLRSVRPGLRSRLGRDDATITEPGPGPTVASTEPGAPLPVPGGMDPVDGDPAGLLPGDVPPAADPTRATGGEPAPDPDVASPPELAVVRLPIEDPDLDATTLPAAELGVVDDGVVVSSAGPQHRSSGAAGPGPIPVPVLVPWEEVALLTAAEVDGAGPDERVVELDLVDSWWAGWEFPRLVRAPAAQAALAVEAAGARRPGGAAGAPPRTDRAVRRRRHRTWGAVAAAVVVLAAVLGAEVLGSSDPPPSAAAGNPVHGRDAGNRSFAHGHPSAELPSATSTPKPAPSAVLTSAPLATHEIFGYAPYWTLPQASGFDVNNLTTLAYFSVDANGNGTLNQSGAGWNGYQSQDLVDLVNRAHGAGDRVVLTVTCFSQASLDQITSDPAAPGRLAAALVQAVSAKNLDGVNFDFEGEGSGDQAGLTSLVTQVSAALHAANPHWQVTMAVYASAAGDPHGFYNIGALAPALDGFFVMAYDMNSRSTPSATSPLVGGGFNDTEALQQFTAVVPPSKVVLGVPYYGYDWPTVSGAPGAAATGGESPLSDSVITASGHPTYWDPSTQTAWTSYQVGTQWHETYFDDPTSLALKAQLADQFHIAGLGVWALGMDGNDPAMLAALLGNAPVVKDLQTGPTVTTTTAPPPPGSYTTTGVWQGATVTLAPTSLPPLTGTLNYLGTLDGLASNDPSLACVTAGPPPQVWQMSQFPGVDVVVASPNGTCPGAAWTFVPPATAPPPPPPPPPPASTTTTTTRPNPPTTTTTTPPPTTTTVAQPSGQAVGSVSTTVPPSVSTTVPSSG